MLQEKAYNLADLQTGDHLCGLYTSEEERRAMLVPLIEFGLKQNRKVLYVPGDDGAQIMALLDRRGHDVNALIASGRLALHAVQAVYNPSSFSVENILRFVATQEKQAIADGFCGLCGIGEMNWACTSVKLTDDLIEYEGTVTAVAKQSQSILACLYDQRLFNSQFLLHISANHTTSIIGDRVYHQGRVIPLEQFVSDKAAASSRPVDLNITLFENEPLCRSLAEHAADGLYISSAEGTILYANKCACDQMGYEQKELQGLHLTQIDAGHTPAELKAFRQKLFQNYPLTLESKHRRKDGSVLPVELRLAVFEMDGQKCSLAIARDLTARKEAERKLAESRRELSTLLEHSPDSIVRIDKDLRYVYVNHVLRGLNYSKEDVLGKRQQDMNLPEHIRRLWEQRLQKIFATGEAFDIELAFPTENGERTLQCKAVPEKDETGTVEYVLVTTRDVTAQKETEKALRQSEKRYRRILEDHADLIARALPDCTVTYANEACVRSFKTTKEQFLGANYLSFIPGEQQARLKKMISELTPENPEAEIEHNIVTDDGEIRYQQWINRGVFDEHGRLVEVQGAGRDVTERKRTEEELRLKQAAIESSVNCMTILDLNGYITYANRITAEWWGGSQEEVIGRHISSFFTSEEETRSALAQVLEDGSWSGEQAAVRKDGSVFYIHSSGHLVRNEIGEPACIMASAIDISERKKAEQELRIKDIAIESSINATSFLSLNQELLYSNRAAIELWGYTHEDEVIGKPATVFFAEPAAFDKMFLELVEKGNWRGELRGLRKDGTEFDLLIAGSLITGEHNEPLFVVGSCTDITERKLAEEELRQTHARLSRAHDELHKINEELEERVRERTAELSHANEVLKKHIEERERVEVALRKSEANYRLIFETAASMITTVNRDGMIISCNRRSDDILGYKAIDLVGQHISKIVAPECHDQARASLERAFATGVGHKEITLLKKDGTKIFAHVNSSVLYSDSGEPINSICMVEDITGRKKAELALKESAERYRTLVENQTGLLVKSDYDGRLLFVSPSYCELMGQTEEELLGKIYLPVVHPDDLPVTLKAIEQLRNPPYNCYVEHRIKTIYGWRWIAWADQTVLTPDGKIEAIVAAGRDVTERHKAEEELRKSEEKYRKVVELSNDGICIVQNRESQYVNPQLKRILGYGEDDDLGKTLAKYIHPDAYPRQRQTYEQLMAGEIEEDRYESLLIHRDGHSINVEVSYGLTTYDGRPAVLGFIRDITEEKSAATKLLEYQKQLQTLASELSLAEERERRQIATDLHDRIGQTLAVAKMQLSVLRQSIHEPETAESTDQVMNYLEQAMQDSRLLTREISPPILYELGLEAAVQWLTELFEEQHGIAVDFIDDNEPKPVSNDIRIVLFKSVRELLVNVAKHADADHVTVSMARCGNKIKIVVEDNGMGFHAKTYGSRLGRTGGFGLFNIHERLVHLGGGFSIKSSPEKGTCIKLTAPVTNNAETINDNQDPDC